MKEGSESDLEDLEEGSLSVVSPGGDRKQRTERADRMVFNAAGMGGFPLTRMNDSNYKTWAVKAEVLLRRERIWQFVNNPPAQFNEEQEQDHEKALSTLVLSIEDNQFIFKDRLQQRQSGISLSIFTLEKWQEQRYH